MKRKKIKFQLMLVALMAIGISIFSGCENQTDLYNPERVQDEAKAAFPIKGIDPNQTWETSTLCNASITIGDQPHETYTVKIYTANPYSKNENALLLAQTAVNGSTSAHLKFDIPSALSYIYVMKVNSKGYSSAIPVAVKNGMAEIEFNNEASATRAAVTRVNSESFFTPEIPDSKKFPTIAPSNCGDINNYGEKKNEIPYLLKDATYRNVNPWQGGDLYIQGNVTLTSWSEPSGIANFYLLPNSTLTFQFIQFNHRPNSIFSIGEGARLIASATVLKGEAGSQYVNKGSIEAKSIEVTNSYLYNAGTIRSESLILTNADSKVYNATDGKLYLSDFKIEGNGHFTNETGGIVENTGTTTLNCNQGSWENAGHYTTGTMNLSAWNNNIKNSCWLTVENKLTFLESGIYNEGYIGCNDLYMQNTTINQASGAFFEVKQEATFQDNYENKGFIASSTGDWAVLKIGKAISNNNHNWKDIAYIGKLYIACNDHFSIGDQRKPTYKLEGGALFAGETNAEASIPQSECNPGYNTTPDGGGNSDQVQTYTYAFEDEEIGDYDFNDVVLQVSSPYSRDNKKYIDVTLKAAGAMKELRVLFKHNGTVQTLFEDIHTALGVPVGTLTNTGGTNGTPKTVTIEVEEDFNLTTAGDFYISDGKREIHIPNFTPNFKAGNVPYAIRIAEIWQWPKEGIDIATAYTGFADWAKNAENNPEWYKTAVSNMVME